MQCGPIRFNMSARTMTQTMPFEHKVIPRHTDFRMLAEMTDLTIQDVYAALVNDSAGNSMIGADLRSAMKAGRSPLLLTGRFDDARLDTLFLALPISWKGTLQQYVGRLHRLHDGKRVIQVYDYVDPNVPMLARMFERRLKGHDAIGYTVDRAGVSATAQA